MGAEEVGGWWESLVWFAVIKDEAGGGVANGGVWERRNQLSRDGYKASFAYRAPVAFMMFLHLICMVGR